MRLLRVSHQELVNCIAHNLKPNYGKKDTFFPELFDRLLKSENAGSAQQSNDRDRSGN